jgi:hypothetical protein
MSKVKQAVLLMTKKSRKVNKIALKYKTKDNN